MPEHWLCERRRGLRSRPSEPQLAAGRPGDPSNHIQLRAAEPGLPRQVLSDLAEALQAHRIPDDMVLDVAQSMLHPGSTDAQELGDPIENARRIGAELLVMERHPGGRWQVTPAPTRLDVVVLPRAGRRRHIRPGMLHDACRVPAWIPDQMDDFDLEQRMGDEVFG